MRTFKAIIIASLAVFSLLSQAEPWLASRFAQNCAACHAPGRVNPPENKQRRCSFTCKACHTNPNGGGVRNFYGKWNEERWLHSFKMDGYTLDKPRPQVTAQQAYQEARLKNYIAGVKDPKDLERLRREGFRLAETNQELPESEYDRRSTPAPIVEDQAQVQMRIPEIDPYRLTRQNYFNAGVDFRWFYLNKETNSVKSDGLVPMSTDLGVTVTPLNHLTVVWESKFLTDPTTADVWDQAYTTGSDSSKTYAAGATVRSAYVMADNFAYNTYAMYGIYRPMFGNDSSDSTTLFAQATGLGQRATFKAFGAGTNQNFPYVNVNVVEPFADRTMAQDRGFIVNVGGHFAPWSSYLRLSWWNTKAKDWTADRITSYRRQALTGGFTKGRLSFTGAVTNLMIDVPNVRRDTGTLISLEPRIRLWREVYFKSGYEYLNTSPTLRFGKATQWSGGFSSFLLSGIEFEMLYKKLKSEETGTPTDTTQWWGQMHFFF